MLFVEKICKHCGKPFNTNNPQKIYCNNPHYRPCPVCGVPVLMGHNDFNRPPKCCSSECTHTKRKQNFNPMSCEICGDSFIPSSGVQKVCNKVHYRPCQICGKEIIQYHKNDEKCTCSEVCSQKLTKQRNIEKYGVDHPMKLLETRLKLQLTMQSKYGVKHALQKHDISRKQQAAAYITNMEHNGVPYACLLPQCVEAQGRIVSNINIKFANKLKSANIPYKLEFSLEDKSFDIALPGKNTLIEIDPTYTHSIIANHWGNSLDKYYHRDKSKLANKYGYRCIHIFDWDNEDDIINLLLPRTRIYARNCQIVKLDPEIGNKFLMDYHIQGTCKGQSLYLGLYNQEKLYQIMTFGKPRYSKSYTFELLRMCTLPGYQVIGGASKLFTAAIKDYGLHNIISYCDISKFTGEVYNKLGMVQIRTTPPYEVWSKGTEKITSNLLRSRGYDQLFNTNYGKGVSNTELMLNNGWLPVYDCGQFVYEYK